MTKAIGGLDTITDAQRDGPEHDDECPDCVEGTVSCVHCAGGDPSCIECRGVGEVDCDTCHGTRTISADDRDRIERERMK